jgi:hypothetical protein
MNWQGFYRPLGCECRTPGFFKIVRYNNRQLFGLSGLHVGNFHAEVESLPASG